MSNKELILEMCRKILSAKEESIEILRETPISNIRALRKQRTTANVSAPLVSTMTNMYRPYPLSIERSLAMAHGVPRTYLLEKEDTHTSNRILCKREALSWWANNSPMPSQETIDIIQLVYKGHFAKTKDFMSINWSRAGVQWGPTVLERKSLVVREAAIRMESREISRACLFLLGASPIPPKVCLDTMNKLIEIRDLNIASKMTFFSQYSVLRANLKDDIRMLPTSRAVPMKFARFSYAVLGINYTLTGILLSNTERESSVQESWMNAIYKSFYMNTEGANTDHLDNITIQNLSLRDILANQSIQNSSSRYLRALMGIETYMVRKIKRVIIDVEEHDPHYQFDKKHQVYKDTTRHSIYFKCDEARGYASVFHEVLEHVTINKCSTPSFKSCMAAIAVYLNKDLHKRNLSIPLDQFFDKVYYYYERNPFKVFDKGLNLIFSHDMVSKYVNFAETEFGTPSLKIFTRSGKILLSPKGIRWDFEKPSGDYHIPNDAIVPRGAFEDAFDPIKALRRRVQYYMHDSRLLLTNVKAKKFGFMNNAFTPYISHSEQVSLCCRESCEYQAAILESMEKEDEDNFDMQQYKYHLTHLAVFYCFSGPTPAIAVSEVISTFTFHEKIIDLTFNQGLITMGANGLCIGGVVVDKEVVSEEPQFYLGFFKGFRMRKRKAEDTYQPVKAKRFQEIRDTLEEGQSIGLMMDQPWILTKDSQFGSQVTRTLKRNFANVLPSASEDIDETLLAIKRAREMQDEDEDDDFMDDY